MSIKVIKRIFQWRCCCVAVWKESVCQGGLYGYLHYAWQVMDWPHGQQQEPHRSTGRAQALLLYLVVKQMCHKQQDGVLQEFNAETHAFRISIVMLRDKVSLFLVYPGVVLLIWAELVWVTSSAGGNQSFSCGSDGHLKTEQKWWLTAQCVTLCNLLFAHWLVLCKRKKSNLVYTWWSVWGNLWSGWELYIFNWTNIRQEKSMFVVPLCFAFAGCLTLGEHSPSHSDRAIHAQLWQEPFQAWSEWCVQAQWGSTLYLY